MCICTSLAYVEATFQLQQVVNMAEIVKKDNFVVRGTLFCLSIDIVVRLSDQVRGIELHFIVLALVKECDK